MNILAHNGTIHDYNCNTAVVNHFRWLFGGGFREIEF